MEAGTPIAVGPTTEHSPREVVETFVAALERLDLDAAVALVDDEIRWVNAPLTTARNKRQFEKALRGMFRNAELFEVRYADIHERGNGVVYTDRVDIFEGGGIAMKLPVQGEFRVREGRIVEWVDRFSWVTLIKAIATSVPNMLRHRFGKP